MEIVYRYKKPNISSIYSMYYIACPLTNYKTKQDNDIIEVVSMQEAEEVVSLPPFFSSF